MKLDSGHYAVLGHFLNYRSLGSYIDLDEVRAALKEQDPTTHAYLLEFESAEARLNYLRQALSQRLQKVSEELQDGDD
jgi:hypothetical protein